MRFRCKFKVVALGVIDVRAFDAYDAETKIFALGSRRLMKRAPGVAITCTAVESLDGKEVENPSEKKVESPCRDTK